MCYQRGNRRTRQKTSIPPSPSGKSIQQRISQSTRITEDLPSLVYLMYLTKPCHLQLSESHNSARLHPPNKWLLPMLSSSTKISLYTQDGCGKCLGYRPLKDLDIERQELRKITMDCVEDCGYDNLSLSRVMARVFSLKNTPFNMWVIMVYIVWVKTQWSRYVKIAKQKVSRVYENQLS